MARQAPGSPVLEALLDEYEYDALETCAADGTCVLACPVGHRHRQARQGAARAPAQRARGAVALRLAERWDAVERAARAGLRAGDAAARVARGALRGASRGGARGR